jgi:hypothetical protein
VLRHHRKHNSLHIFHTQYHVRRLEHNRERCCEPLSTYYLLAQAHARSQGVFTYLIEKLGAKDVQFDELTTLDPDELKQLGKIYGVIFLFKYPTNEKPSDVPKDGSFDHDAANKLFFAAQTIQNACGTQALLSVLLNKDGEVDIGNELRDFKDFAKDFPPEVS